MRISFKQRYTLLHFTIFLFPNCSFIIIKYTNKLKPYLVVFPYILTLLKRMKLKKLDKPDLNLLRGGMSYNMVEDGKGGIDPNKPNEPKEN